MYFTHSLTHSLTNLLTYLLTYVLIQVIFDRQKYVVSVSSKHGVCNKAMSVSFDYNYHLIVTISDVDAFLNDTVCTKAMSQTSLYNLGYDPAIDGNSFNMRFDIRSMVTSIAANLDILNAWYSLTYSLTHLLTRSLT